MKADLRLVCITPDYPPQTGGVARYLSALQSVSGGAMEVWTPTADRRFFWRYWPKWLPLIARCLEVPKEQILFVSHVLPVGTAAWIASFLGGADYAVLFHGTDIHRIRSRWKRWLVGCISRKARAVFCNSRATADAVQRIVSDIEPVVMTPGVTLERETPPDTLIGTRGKLVVLCVARLVARKGIDTLIQSVSALQKTIPGIEAVIIGDGPERDSLETLAFLMNAPVRFMGRVDDRMLDRCYAEADVFCLPAREEADDVEGFGMVYLEAAAHGLPCIAGKGWGTEEAVVHNKTGLVVLPDAEHVTQAIKKLSEHRCVRRALGEAGYERVRDSFSWKGRWYQLTSALHARSVLKRDIAVVVPCWNHTETLERTLSALSKQTVLPAEVVVVDDGSVDHPDRIVQLFTDRLPISFVRFEENRGAPAARNEGARRTASPYLLFLDADAELRIDGLEKMRMELEAHPDAGFVYSDLYWDGKRMCGRPFNVRALKEQNYIHTSSLIRREVFCGFDETLKKFQDWDLWLTVTRTGGRGVWIPEALFSVSERKTGISTWLPSFFYRIPWPVFGYTPEAITKYREAESIIRRKHQTGGADSLHLVGKKEKEARRSSSEDGGDGLDLHIVIVSWNVKDLVERLLWSLPGACGGLDWSCTVVDNASGDGTVERLRGCFGGDSRIRVVANSENTGFAVGCNQGAEGSDASHVLLLNPDTECPVGSLEALVHRLEESSNVGVIGPKLIYPDGRYQESVRRFPGIWDQVLILLKLHHLIPLRRYFCRDLETEAAQNVDQVMGACFLVKKDCWDALKGLDERYFIWFEEVDFCKRAHDAGWRIHYEPSVSVIHHSGQAFDQVFSVQKQRYFSDSLQKYMRRWYGPSVGFLFTGLRPMSIFLARIVQSSLFERTFVALFLVECFSFLLLDHADLRSIATVGFGLGAFLLAWKRPAWGLVFVGMELIIGGFGHLFSISTSSSVPGISLRVAIMAGFLFGWGLSVFNRRGVLKFLSRLSSAWILLGCAILFGVIHGIVLGNSFLFQDANAWFFLLYLFPAADIALRYPMELQRIGKPVLGAAVVWLSVKSLLTFFIFTHDVGFAESWYRWIRDTRVGEITPADGLVRVFFQSSIYLILVLFWGLSALRKRWSYSIFTLSVFCASGLLIGLSRSFWIGILIAIPIFLLIRFFTKREPGRGRIVLFGQDLLLFSFVGIAGIFLIAGIRYFPVPTPYDGSLGGLFANRLDMDSAVASRWKLLPVMEDAIEMRPVFGYGLGSGLTYQSDDPRVRAISPDGMYTTHAFEWGWLSLWIKFGVLGVSAMLYLLLRLGRAGWTIFSENGGRSVVTASLIGLAVIHFFTPYLDHPLGLGALIFLQLMMIVYGNAKTHS